MGKNITDTLTQEILTEYKKIETKLNQIRE